MKIIASLLLAILLSGCAAKHYYVPPDFGQTTNLQAVHLPDGSWKCPDGLTAVYGLDVTKQPACNADYQPPHWGKSHCTFLGFPTKPIDNAGDCKDRRWWNPLDWLS